jgi:hypothetical protein
VAQRLSPKLPGEQGLLKLEEDIRAVLHMAELLIELSFWAAGLERDAMRTS